MQKTEEKHVSNRHFTNHIAEVYELHAHKVTSGHGDMDTS